MSEHTERLALLSADRRRLFERMMARASGQRARAIPRRRDTGPIVPMSFAQQRLWFVDQLEPGNPAYNCPVAMRLRGPLDVRALRASLEEILRRHEVLRTTYELAGGRAVQRIHDTMPLELTVEQRPGLDAAQRQEVVERLIAEDNEQPFDLVRGPVMRCRLVAFDVEDHVLLVDIHHIANDAWSMRVFFDELVALYPALRDGRPADLPPLDVQYADFALWQREQVSGERRDELVAHWKERLGGVTPLDLPTDRPRPPVLTHRGEVCYVTFDPDLTAQLRELGNRHGATLFMTLLAGFDVLMARYSGQQDIAIGTSTTGRDRPELDGLIGFFVNTLVLRTSLGGDPTFAELVERTRDSALDAYRHAELPFDLLVKELNPERDPSRTALVPVWFILDDTPAECPDLGEASVDIVVPTFTTTKFDLLVNARPTPEGGLVAQVQFSTDLYERATIDRMLVHYEQLLRSLVEAPDAPVSRARILTPEESRRMLVEWNATDEAFPSHACLHELVADRAADGPEHPAVLAGEETLTYREVHEGARRLAARLAEAGIGPGARVAVCVERSAALPLALLGVLYAGAAYVPLDATYPAERLAFMLADADVSAVVTGSAVAHDRLPLGDRPVVSVAGALASGDPARHPPVVALDPARHPPAAALDPERLAYVIYTSGSTGTPKGIAIRHRGIVNNVTDLNRRFRVGRADRLLALSSTSFDMSVYELLGSLAAGASVVVPSDDDRRDPARWTDLVTRHGVTVWNSAPPLLELLVEHCERTGTTLPSLRLALLGGDWIPVDLPDRFRAVAPNVQVVSLGGATEASIHSIVYPIEEVDPSWSSIPYGRPMANQRAYVLDDALQPVPVGVAGELHLAGTGLAEGYVGRPDLTAEKFVETTLEGRRERLYRTGDLARWGPDGVIELLGRRDLLVKIHGLRVEIGEIETLLRSRPEVREAVVSARDEGPRGRQLVAYVVPTSAEAFDPDGLRNALAERLPAYMVPSTIVRMDALPTGLTGKVDRRSLPAPEGPRGTGDGQVPADRDVARLAAAFADVLGVAQVGPDDDFFDLGGDSFLAIRAVRTISDWLPVVDLFLHPTPRLLAARLREGRREGLLHRLSGSDRPRVSLVCVPYGGGSAAAYQPLAESLPDDVALWAVELPGHDLAGEDGELVGTRETAERIAEEVERLVEGPVVVYAQCAGVVVGVELARLLEQRGRAPELCYVGAALPDPDPEASLAREAHTTDDDIERYLSSLGGFDGALDAGHKSRILRLVRHDLTAASRWFGEPGPAERLRTPLRCVVGDRDEATVGWEDRHREWERFALRVSVEVIPGGGHYFVRDKAAELARLLADDLARLGRAHTDDDPGRPAPVGDPAHEDAHAPRT